MEYVRSNSIMYLPGGLFDYRLGTWASAATEVVAQSVPVTDSFGNSHDSSIVYRLNGFEVTFYGAALSLGQASGLPAMTGGVIEGLAIHVTSGPMPTLAFASESMNLVAADLQRVMHNGNALRRELTAQGGMCEGTSGDDRIATWRGYDVVDGNAGNDMIYGEFGHDTLFGGTGNDTVHGGSGYDRLYGEDGRDRMIGMKGNDKIYGGDGNDFVNAGSGRDRILGGAGRDRIHASADADTVDGGAGNDTIAGYTGNDRLTGGSGDDRFVFVRAGGTDRITDFTQGEDVLVVRYSTQHIPLVVISVDWQDDGAHVLLDYQGTSYDSTVILLGISQGGFDPTLGGADVVPFLL